MMVALFATFEFILQLRDILQPLVFSCFLVAAIEKPVEGIYRVLTGRVGCGCCSKRKRETPRDVSFSRERPVDEAAGENQPILPDQRDHPSCTPRTMAELLLAQETACDGCMRIIAVMAVLFVCGCIIAGLGVMVFYSAMSLKEEWPAYKAGAIRVVNSTDLMFDHICKSLHIPQGKVDQYIKESYAKLLNGTESVLWNLLNKVLADLSASLSWMFLTFLYVFFWLLRPLPLTEKLNDIIRNYILKKTVVCLGYGICVGLLFWALHIDLAAVFGLISFVLNYLPEVGPILAMIFPIPIILLDGRLERPFGTLCIALLGQLFLKFLFANYLEVKLIENDQQMNIHPIWVLLGLTFFGFVWGPVGMLLSVPILAMIKVVAMPDTNIVPRSYGPHILACLEGRMIRKSEFY